MRRGTHTVGKDRRVETVHDMPDELLCTSVVNLLLPASLVKHAIEAEADVFDLLAHDGHAPALERRDRIGLGRVENEDAFVEDLEYLAKSARTARLGSCVGGGGGGGRGRVRLEEGGSGVVGRVELESLLLRKGSHAYCRGSGDQQTTTEVDGRKADAPATEMEDDMADVD